MPILSEPKLTLVVVQLPELTPPEEEDTETFRFPETEKISPPVLQLNEVTFGYTPDKILLKNINIDVGLDSRIAVIGPNGAGKSTLCVPSLFYGWLLYLTERPQNQAADWGP